MKTTNKQTNNKQQTTLILNSFRFGIVLLLAFFSIAAAPPEKQETMAVCSSFDFSSQVDCSDIVMEFRVISTGNKIDIGVVTPLDPSLQASSGVGTILSPGAGAPWQPNDMTVDYTTLSAPCDINDLECKVVSIAGVLVNSGWVSNTNTSITIPGTTPCCGAGYSFYFTGSGWALVMLCP